jgi:hypothetical protein
MPNSHERAPEVREAYREYAPPFDVTSLIRELLSYVPADYLIGLKDVVLLNASGLSRRDRRQRVRANGKKLIAERCLGFYHAERPGAPARIEIQVDRILQQVPRLALQVSVFRDWFFAGTLYHEVGHHIHQTLQREHDEPEDVADRWARRLKESLLRQKYHSLTPEVWDRVNRAGRRLEQRCRRQVGADQVRSQRGHG